MLKPCCQARSFMIFKKHWSILILEINFSLFYFFFIWKFCWYCTSFYNIKRSIFGRFSTFGSPKIIMCLWTILKGIVFNETLMIFMKHSSKSTGIVDIPPVKIEPYHKKTFSKIPWLYLISWAPGHSLIRSVQMLT